MTITELIKMLQECDHHESEVKVVVDPHVKTGVGPVPVCDVYYAGEPGGVDKFVTIEASTPA